MDKPSQTSPTAKDVDENHIIAAIGYIWILFLIPLFLKRNSAFSQFHAKQGMIIFIGEVIAHFIPILWPFCILLAILGFVQAMSGKWYRLPFVGDLAEKINL